MDDNKESFEKIDLKEPKGVESKPENLEMIDRSFEAKKTDYIKKQKENLEEAIKKEGEGELGGIVSASNKQAALKERQKKIENVLSRDLEDIYLKMSEERQREFKVRGEETAQKINEVLDSAKFKIKRVIELIRKWLMIIPGVNKFFIEQEIKIKADKILKMRNEINIGKYR